MLKEKLAKERADLLTKKLVRNSFKDHPSTYTPVAATCTVCRRIKAGYTPAFARLATALHIKNVNYYGSLFTAPG